MGDAAEDAARRAEEEREREADAAAEAKGKSPEEQAAEPTKVPESEIHPDEFTKGIGKPVWGNLPEEVEAELMKPLDPNRVRRRQGRGTGQFEYIAGHDAKRRANEIFGFGNWGSEIVSLTETAAVEVVGSNGREGWHVSYSCIVRVTVKGCIPVSDVGYGDGVEYGPAALATARELATKESSTDAMKRALTQFGDQFGLILYAKGDEKQRINRERNVGETTGEAVRRDNVPPVPKSWAEINAWAEPYGESLGWQNWLLEAALVLYGTSTWADLKPPQKTALGQKASGAVVALREAHDPSVFPPPTRKDVQAAWAKVMNGHVLDGPPWRMSPDETDREPLPVAEPPPEPTPQQEATETST